MIRRLMRLPRTRDEGNIPKIALTTGGADVIECLLRKMGIADSEFTPEAGPGRVNLFAGQPEQQSAPPLPLPIPIGLGPRGATRAYAPTLNMGAAFTPAKTFWDDPAAFDCYDMVILSCEGEPYPSRRACPPGPRWRATPTRVAACLPPTGTISGCTAARRPGRRWPRSPTSTSPPR